MQKILVLTSTYPRWSGDVEPAFVHYLNMQLARHYRVIVLAPHYPGARRRETMDGIEVHRFRYFLPFAEHLAYDGGIVTSLKKNRLKLLLVPFFLVSQLFNIYRLCRKNEISLVHAHWVIPQGLLAVLSRKLRLIPKKIKILCTSHGGDLFSLQSGFLQSLKRYAFRHADHVTVVSTAMRENLQAMGCNPENLTVQSMGADLKKRFTPAADAVKTHDLVFVGRLVEKKGVATLIESLRLLQPEFPALKVSIIGDGPDRPALEQQALELGVSRQLDFIGSTPNEKVPEHYRSARIAVVPSLVARDGDQEGLGLVAVEALGCGCAIIASDLPALRDVVTDGENGLVFRSGDAQDLASNITRLLSDDVLYNHLVDNGRRSVEEKFDWQAVGASYTSIITHCIDGQTS
jgi:glycosyltransferase involved in cell wall biosynthesis